MAYREDGRHRLGLSHRFCDHCIESIIERENEDQGKGDQAQRRVLPLRPGRISVVSEPIVANPRRPIVGVARRYNPHSYQKRSVWLRDNGLIALGFKRYGYAGEAGGTARDMSNAGSFFMLNQLPELHAGLHHRDAPRFGSTYSGNFATDGRSAEEIPAKIGYLTPASIGFSWSCG
jgi:hypothetical protein